MNIKWIGKKACALLTIALLSFASSAAATQHIPAYFYAVSNWYYGISHSTAEYDQLLLAHQFKTPHEAFSVDWGLFNQKCPNGSGYFEELNEVYPVQVPGHDPDDYYQASYIQHYNDDCSNPTPEPMYGSAAQKYVNCNGNIWVHGSDNPKFCPDPTFNPDKNKGPPTCPCNAKGDPVNPATGNKFEILDVFRGQGPFPLDFSITYNAGANPSALRPGQMTLGYGRTHSYMRLVSVYTVDGSSTAYVVRPDGKVLAFDKVDTTWVGEADARESFDAIYATDGSVTGWTLTDSSGTVERYNIDGQLVSLTQRGGLTQTLSYDANGQLATVTDARGRQLAFAYDANGYISSMTTPAGEVYGFAYDASHNLAAITYPDTTQLQFHYNENGGSGNLNSKSNLTSVIDEAGIRIDSTTYDSNDRVTSTTGAEGAGATTFSYTLSGSGTSATVSSYTVTDALGATETATVQYNVGVATPSDTTRTCSGCSVQSHQYTYDANGRVATSTDGLGNLTSYIHDALGLETQRIENQGAPTQRTIQTDWNDTLRAPTERRVLDANNAPVAKSQWLYNARGQTLARCKIDPAQASGYTCDATGIVPPGVRRWTYIYCDAVDGTQCPLVGLLLSVDGPRINVSDITQYRYYLDNDESGCGTVGATCHRAGDIYQVSDALGHTTTYVAYDKDGRVVRQRDANGVDTDLTYTPRGWLATRTVGGATTTIDYWPYGAVRSVTDPDGVTTSYTYDAAHRLTDITDALGNRIHYTLDAAGNKTREETFDVNGAVRRSLARSYNTLGQLIAVNDGFNLSVFNAGYGDSYDAEGNLLHTVDAQGVQRLQGYDALNRLVSTIDDYNGSNPTTQNAQSVFTYDARGNLEGVSDPDGLATTYDYDGLNNLLALHSPDTGTSTYSYDAAGNTISETDARGITSFRSYDALNRLTMVSYPDSTQNIAYYYDDPDSFTGCNGSYPVGRLTRVLESNLVTLFCYDARGNVTFKTQPQGMQTDATGYNYTPAGRLIGINYPSGTRVTYTRDADGRIQSASLLAGGNGASTAVSAVSYLPFGPVASYTLGNGQTITRSYDANYALTDITSPALNLHFVRDPMGNIGTMGNTPGANPPTEIYRYDPLYRLASVSDVSGTAIETYIYNKTGDRMSKTGSGLATGNYTYRYRTHWLTSTGTDTRSYDAAGNTIARTLSGESYGFSYNDRNRLATAQRNGNTVGTYTYDAFGERVAKTATLPTSISERYVYNQAHQLLGEYGSNNRDYIWLDNLPVAVVDISGITSSTVAYIHADGLGTPRVVTDSAGATIWQWPYASNPFGEQQPTSSNGYALNLRFPGQYYDAESGLAYNVNRDYEAATGRYVQSDPMGLGGGLSTYGYVRAHPLMNIDPRGLDVAVVIDHNTVPILGRYGGHSGVLVGNENTGWDYYSKNGVENGVQQDTHQSYPSLDAFWKDMGNVYDSGTVFETSATSDQAMKQWADAHYRDEYKRLSNNCADFVYDVLKVGGIRTNPPRWTVSIPNDMLDGSGDRIDQNQPHYLIENPNNPPGMFENGYW